MESDRSLYRFWQFIHLSHFVNKICGAGGLTIHWIKYLRVPPSYYILANMKNSLRKLILCIEEKGTLHEHFKVLQAPVTHTPGSLHPGWTPKTTLTVGEPVNMFISKRHLQWMGGYDETSSYLMLLCDIGGSVVLAQPMKYTAGQTLYDIELNQAGKILDIPSSSNGWYTYREEPKPLYIMKLSWRYAKLVSEEDIEHLIIGPTHQAAASTRISQWYQCLRYNRVIRI